MYQYSTPNTNYSGSRIPRRYVQTVDLDDYLQLQLLLQQERERRQAEQERRRAAEQEYRRRLEERRLEEALARLYYIQQLRQQQRLEEERRVRREQRYRAELLATLQGADGEEYRRRLQGAIERQKQWEAARVKRESDVREQRKACSRGDGQRVQLEALLKHLLGNPEAEQEEDSDEDKVPESLGEDGPAWKIYYRPTPTKPHAARKSPPKPTPATSGRQEKLKAHVVPLQPIIESLLERLSAEEESADASNPKQQREQQRQQQQAKDFEKFMGNIFPGQQQSASSSKAGETKPTEAKQPTAPAMSEKDAASKIESWYKSAHDAHAISQVTKQLGMLSDISSKIDKLQDEYEQAVFQTPLMFSDVNSAELSPQSHGARNWLRYEDEIMKLLVQLDTIESYGSDVVRDRRKELVQKATALLDRLDEYKHEEFERVSNQSEAEDSEKSDKAADSETSSKVEPYTIPEPQQPEISEESSASAVAESESQQPETAAVATDATTTTGDAAVAADDTTTTGDAAALPLPTPNHPHPENPNATTVDDGEDEDNDAGKREEDEFVVV